MAENNTDSDIAAVPYSALNRLILIVVSLAVLGGVIWYLYTAEYTVDVAERTEPREAPWVSTETIQVASQVVEISAFAEVKPRWSVEITAAVSGKITNVLSSALAGEPVTEGTPLIEIDKTRYKAELAAAELAVEEANLALWQAKNDVVIARKEFERANRKPPNDLALKLPQLEIAKKSVTSAEAQLAAARQQLRNATVIAPFSGFVTDRFVSPGQTASTGDRLVKLVDNSTFELTVELSRNDWLLLQKPIEGLSARIVDQAGNTRAKAKIRQGGGFLDETTRQYKVFLEVDGATHADLLSGDFVRVILPGKSISTAFNVPASSLTQDGKIWHIDNSYRLRRFDANVLFRSEDRIVITAPSSARTLYVAVTPLASFLPGQLVQAY